MISQTFTLSPGYTWRHPVALGFSWYDGEWEGGKKWAGEVTMGAQATYDAYKLIEYLIRTIIR